MSLRFSSISLGFESLEKYMDSNSIREREPRGDSYGKSSHALYEFEKNWSELGRTLSIS